MARIMAIDYGTKNVGLAVTDNSQIIATSLSTIHAKDVIVFLKNYFSKENVECIVVGEPKQMNNTPSQSAVYVEGFIKELANNFPDKTIKRMDERFTSKMAAQTMLAGGLKKSDRRDKKKLDEISAVLILQNYLEQQSYINPTLRQAQGDK